MLFKHVFFPISILHVLSKIYYLAHIVIEILLDLPELIIPDMTLSQSRD